MSTVNLMPNATGDETNIPSQTPDTGEHWDKLLTNDGDTTKVYGSGIGWVRDLYSIEPPTVTGAISRVSVRLGVKAIDPDPDYSNLKVGLKTYGVIYEPTEIWLAYALNHWVGWWKNWDTNPFTGVAWLWSDIRNLQIGASIRNPNDEVALTYVFARVTYASGNPGFIWAEGNKLHWKDESADERRILGSDSGINATAGHLFVEGTSLHYVDENGDERKQWGSPPGGTGTAGHIWIDDMWIYYVTSAGFLRKLGTWTLGGSRLGVDTILHP